MTSMSGLFWLDRMPTFKAAGGRESATCQRGEAFDDTGGTWTDIQ